MLDIERPNNIAQCKWNIENTSTTMQMYSQNTSPKQSLSRSYEDIPSKSLVGFTSQVKKPGKTKYKPVAL